MEFLRIAGIGLMLTSGANLVAAKPPHVTVTEDWALWGVGNSMVILAVVMIVNLAREGRK